MHSGSNSYSFNAKKRLEEMETCGLDAKEYRKSVQAQNKIALTLGLSRGEKPMEAH